MSCGKAKQGNGREGGGEGGGGRLVFRWMTHDKPRETAKAKGGRETACHRTILKRAGRWDGE